MHIGPVCRWCVSQLRIVWLYDSVSEQRPCLGIVSLKVNDRACRSLAASAIFLDVGCANDLQGRIARERRRCRELGAARATDAPGRFKHA
jgi:hypothetical protein